MTADGIGQIEDRLTLGGRLPDVSRIPPWIEHLASRHAIPPTVEFAINLCLEEAVSNVIRHGYGGEADRPVTVSFAMPREAYFLFVIEDEAPHFNPLNHPEPPAFDPLEEIRVGGQGIRLMRRFADCFEYEAMPTGNRLRLGFLADKPAAPSE